jgi:hypothetical protein
MAVFVDLERGVPTEIDEEVEEALMFTPALEDFWILTTAPDDTELQEHVRQITERHEKANLFNSSCGFKHTSVRRNPRKPEILRMHNEMLVLFVLNDLGEDGVDLLLRRPHCIPVGDTTKVARQMSKEGDL